MVTATIDIQRVHIRIEGRSDELTREDIARLGLRASMTDGEIKTALSRHLDISEQAMSGYEIDRASETGALILREEAPYG